MYTHQSPITKINPECPCFCIEFIPLYVKLLFFLTTYRANQKHIKYIL